MAEFDGRKERVKHMDKYYVGCTIGPVYSLIQKARQPLEIWMASYMFSRIAQEMVKYLLKEKAEFYSPYYDDANGGTEWTILTESIGAGAFSDRLFFKIQSENENGAKEYAVKAMQSALDALCTDILTNGCTDENKKRKCISFLQKYIFCRITVVQADPKKYPAIPMREMTQKLDLLEKYVPYLDEEKADESDFLLKYIDADYLVKKSQWIKDNKVRRMGFGSLATVPSKKGLLSNKYIAMIRADGDRMGEILGLLSDNKDEKSIRKLSNFLLKQAKNNVERVEKFGALPIFFGGDDMLFIAPLFGNSADGKRLISVFDLIYELSNSFDREFKNLEITTGIEPSLSFGVSISYFKHPLQMINSCSLSALFGHAKKAKWVNGKEKKATYIHLRKHSGQQSEVCLSMWPSDNNADIMYKSFLNIIDQNPDSITIRSIHWKIIEHYDYIAYMLFIKNSDIRKARLKQWFEKNLNEWECEETSAEDGSNTKNSKEDFIEKIIALICCIKDQTPIEYEDEMKSGVIKGTIDGIFRIDEFLKTKDDDSLEGGDDSAVSISDTI